MAERGGFKDGAGGKKGGQRRGKFEVEWNPVT